MTLSELKILVKKGEGQHLEFKKKANHPDKIMKEVVAFANTDGGTLLVGVDDDGTLSGTRSIEGEAFIVEKAIKELTRPQVMYDVKILKINEKKALPFLTSMKVRKNHILLRKIPILALVLRLLEEMMKVFRQVRKCVKF